MRRKFCNRRRTAAHLGETTAAGTTTHCLTPPRWAVPTTSRSATRAPHGAPVGHHGATTTPEPTTRSVADHARTEDAAVMLLSDSPLQQSARDHLLLHFSRNGSAAPLLVLERGEGPYVYDTQGRAYLDGLSGLFCAQLGYSY